MSSPVIVTNIPFGINNTIVIERTRTYGDVVEWELHHSCFDSCISFKHILNKHQIEQNCDVFCPYCKTKIVGYNNIAVAMKKNPGERVWI